MDMFPKLMGAISEWFSSIGSKITAFFADMLPDWAKRFLGGATGSASSEAQTSSESTPAINDGIVQNGKVVSTNPADTIIATKNPQGLGNQIGGNTIDISALVSKMDEMIQAVSKNRDVYMDREKVSAAVVTTSEKSSQNRFGLMGA
jgi:hypothetical protein